VENTLDNSNPYLEQVHKVLPRLLALYDRDPHCPNYGMGDRFHWAWKLIDFGNGTFQGAAHGLARLVAADLLPDEISKDSIMRRIDAMFIGAQKLRRPNGSMEEAFPYESSFCVTALVAYDLLTVMELLNERITPERRKQYLEIIRPMIRFLHRADEVHAVISNHLATAVVALYKWNAITGEAGEERGKLFLDRILQHQSQEGWFCEYEGLDPGYQSLCAYYLADLHRLRPDLGLLEPLQRSYQCLWYFAHPDGSFGGLYGSRNTRFYYPAGAESLGMEVLEAASLASFMRTAIQSRAVVTLEVMDEPNLIPMFNAYCWAAALFEQNKLDAQLTLPAQSPESWRKQFPKAGLFLDKGENHYTIVSWRKGGVCYHFQGTAPAMIDPGVVVKSGGNSRYSTQTNLPDNKMELYGDTLTVTAPFCAMHHQCPDPLRFIVLRLLNVTVMRSLVMGNWIKKALVKMLITSAKPLPVSNRREITLGPDLMIKDSLQGSHAGYQVVETKEPFSAIHMASQGYWQSGDDSA
jgi:hypothetical protein